MRKKQKMRKRKLLFWKLPQYRKSSLMNMTVL